MGVNLTYVVQDERLGLADAFKVMIDRGRKVVFQDIPGYHIDVGTPEELREANRLFYLQMD